MAKGTGVLESPDGTSCPIDPNGEIPMRSDSPRPIDDGLKQGLEWLLDAAAVAVAPWPWRRDGSLEHCA